MATKINKSVANQQSAFYTSTLRFARISPRKVNYVAELIRGLNANRAIEILMFNPKRASYFLYKLLKSAISNAISKNSKVDVDKLYLKEVKVNGGPMLKRIRSAPRGRAVMIRRRFSHITITLEEAKISKKEDKTPSDITITEPSGQKEKEKIITEEVQQKKEDTTNLSNPTQQ